MKGFIHDHGMPPTVREIRAAFEIKSSSVFDLLQALERKGHLRRGDVGARSLIVKGRSQRHGCACQEVREMGRVRAGVPVEAIEDDCGAIAVKKDLLRGREAYALKVEGSSMIEAGILDERSFVEGRTSVYIRSSSVPHGSFGRHATSCSSC